MISLRSAAAAVLLLAALTAADDECAAAPADAAYASPGMHFPTDWLEVPVLAVRTETLDSKVITFRLPAGASLNLPISSAILMKAPGVGDGGKDVIKPYNPISSNKVLGSFELLVKVYAEGTASAYAGRLQPGDRVSLKQVAGNIKPFRYPFTGVERLTMLAVGTGIAPMLQALWPLLETPGDATRVRLLYGNKSPDDIMLKATLDELARAHADRFEVVYVVGEDAHDDRAIDNFGWEGETGWVDLEKVKRLAFPPAEGSVVWVCGMDAFYNDLAGSRMKPLAPGSALHELGYTDAMVWRS